MKTKGMLLAFIALILVGCLPRQTPMELLVERVMASPDGLDSILANDELSKGFHDSIFVRYDLPQQIEFVKEIGAGYSTQKTHIVNEANPGYDDIEWKVFSSDANKWLVFRFHWSEGKYLLVGFASRLAHFQDNAHGTK